LERPKYKLLGHVVHTGVVIFDWLIKPYWGSCGTTFSLLLGQRSQACWNFGDGRNDFLGWYKPVVCCSFL